MSDSNTSLETLRVQCEDEVTRFYRQGIKESPACYELLKRALEKNNPLAFAIVYKIYEPQVRNWIVQHSQYSLTHQTIEHFVSAAFSSFYSALRGKPLHKFPTTAHVLKYLKTCVHTSILHDLRSERKHQLEDELRESVPDRSMDTNNTGHELWTRIYTLIQISSDLLLIHAAFVEDRKPAEIATLYPQHWPSAREVSIDLYRIRKLLRHDPTIKNLRG